MSHFDEWRQEQALTKAPSKGGTQSPIAPGFGSMGPQGNPSKSPGGNYSFKPDSKYGNSHSQADPWISDVDMEANWYSPRQPVWPFGPPAMDYAREWDYPDGYNINFIQGRMNTMSMLRGMRASWGVLATIIETRKDQLLRVPYTFQRRDKPRSNSAGVALSTKFFKRPDGKITYSQWSRKLLDDLLVLDAPAVYLDRANNGKLLRAEVLDAATIFPLIDDAGRRPDYPNPAFQQIIKGLPMVNLTEQELMYVPMRPRSDFPMFGYPGTEQIMIEASEAVRKTFYQLGFWAEGSIPDLVVTVPDGWSPRQIAMFQAHFDALLSGNLALKSKVRFLPGGMKPFDIKNANGETLWSQRDETLIRLACYAYSVSPTPFVKQTNRSVAQNAQQSAEEEGLYPLMSFWKDDIVDPIIEYLGFDDIEFVYLPRPEPDSEKQAKIHQIQVKEGIRPRNEVRAELGLEPLDGGDVAMIELGNIIVPLSSAAKGDAATAMGGGGSPTDSSSPAKLPSPAGGQPQRGAAKPAHQTPTPSSAPIRKATQSELEAAADHAEGDINGQSHLVLHDGNYRKGHIWIQGLNISIENKKGSKRGKKDANGKKKWEVTMPAHYGYIRGTIGADDDHIDVFVGKDPESPTVWVIDQNKISPKGKDKGFDEHKVLIGYSNLASGLRDYLISRSQNHDQVDKISEMSMKDFRQWLVLGDTRSPIASSGYGKVVVKQKDFAKANTISASSGLSFYSQGATHARKKKPKSKRRSVRGPRWLSLSAEAR